jgi:hypothetical protein
MRPNALLIDASTGVVVRRKILRAPSNGALNNDVAHQADAQQLATLNHAVEFIVLSAAFAPFTCLHTVFCVYVSPYQQSR